MSSKFESLKKIIKNDRRKWLVTGVAGFIGSSLLDALLKMDQDVIGLDNFSTGNKWNLDDVRSGITTEQWQRFTFIEGDIRDTGDCMRALYGVEHVLHQAALGSIPRSYADPLLTNDVNVAGFLNLLIASRTSGAKSFVYASSSSVYGDHAGLPKKESVTGKPLSPYAVTKLINERYADVFAQTCDLKIVGLRYFNVFGPRQSSDSCYAAVIPKWVSQMLGNEQVIINGDGKSSRDFCYVDNVVQANLLASVGGMPNMGSVYNVALQSELNLIDLFRYIRSGLKAHGVDYKLQPVYRDFRIGDVRHSMADIASAKHSLGYEPLFTVEAGLDRTLGWYVRRSLSDSLCSS